MKRQNIFAVGSILLLIASVLFAVSCSGTTYVEDCKLVSPRYQVWKCRK